MKIEQEAKEFVRSKKEQFNEGLKDAVNNLDSYIFENLYECEEREVARERIIESSMWARLAANSHGIK